MEKTQNELLKEISEFTEAELLAISKKLGLEEPQKETKSKIKNNIYLAITLCLSAAYIYTITNFVKILSENNNTTMAFAVNFFVAFVLPILLFRSFVALVDYTEKKIENIIDKYKHLTNYIFVSFFATCLAIIASYIYFTS
ncbi:TPA: hypothetical protein ACKTGI_003481 [Pseudomonas aeruginosa]